MSKNTRTMLISKNGDITYLNHIKEGKFYFEFPLIAGLRITEAMKKKYNFSIDTMTTSGTVRFVDLNFLYAVRDNEEFRKHLLEHNKKHMEFNGDSWKFAHLYTEEELLEQVNSSIKQVETKDYIIW